MNSAGTFPDFREVVEDVIADRDMVVTRFTASGTHCGPLQSFAPTGRMMTMAEIGVFRLAGGKIVEKWGVLDPSRHAPAARYQPA